jgi:hypothetical protein
MKRTMKLMRALSAYGAAYKAYMYRHRKIELTSFMLAVNRFINCSPKIIHPSHLNNLYVRAASFYMLEAVSKHMYLAMRLALEI